MNRTSWVIGLALLFCLLAGCSSPPTGPSPNHTVPATTAEPQVTGGGISDVTVEESPRLSKLADALHDLTSTTMPPEFNASELKVHQVNGIGVDRNGEAQMWVLGAYQGVSTLLIYTDGEWRMVEWQGTLPSEEIDLSAIILPDVLYGNQSSLLEQALTRHNTGTSNLEIVGNTYTITVTSSGTITILSFNAQTGELLSST
jgi:hypothetical protein